MTENEEELHTERKTILCIQTQDDKYIFSSDAGSSVAEIAFSIAALIKVFIRDGIVKDDREFISLVARYFADPQYDEVTEVN